MVGEHAANWAEQRAATPFNETLEYPGEALMSFSLSPTLMEDIRRAAYNKMDAKAHVRLCTMPTVLRALGEPEGDVYTLPGTISKLVYTHNLAHPEVYRTVVELEDPLLVFKETGKTYVFVLEMEATNTRGKKSNVMAAIELERSDSGHYLLSAYPLDALTKIKDLQKQGRLMYSKYTSAELENQINKQATPPVDNAPSPFKLDLMRSTVKGGLGEIVMTKQDIVKRKAAQTLSGTASVSFALEPYTPAELAEGFLRRQSHGHRLLRRMAVYMRNQARRYRFLYPRMPKDTQAALQAIADAQALIHSMDKHLPLPPCGSLFIKALHSVQILQKEGVRVAGPFPPEFEPWQTNPTRYLSFL